ncbi:MAG: UvrD-helicase domain-containing protein [Candidatus Doudnabacteria bacterium]|nr:UvrD-helicase domain-containing protein [Candidatus Doudnabacteria bacterium]
MEKTRLKLEVESKTLAGLNREQKEAVRHGEGPLLIVAGAGTGKTTVITRRIAYLVEQGVKPEEILALAFGEKAAAEMEERVDQLLPYGYVNLQISTFHAFCERVLRDQGLAVGLPDFKVLNEVGQWLLIRNNLDKFELDYYRPLGNPTRFIKALVQHFARAKDELITPEEYLGHAEKIRLNLDTAHNSPPPSLTLREVSPPLRVRGGGEELSEGSNELKRIQEVANAYHAYQRLLLENSALDFGDLINYTLELFKKRQPVLEYYRKKFKHILIDEFQDTNFAQYELLKLLAAPKNNLTVVGDDDQSIFKFRGASISNILHFQRDYPKAKFITLVQNYRNPQNILDLAHRFIRQNDPDRLEVKLNVSKRLVSAKTPPASPPHEGEGAIEVLETQDYLAEADLVIEKILEIKEKNAEATWNDFAILARSHDALEPILNKLDLHEIPYIYFANRGLYHKPIILDILSYFKLLDNYHESGALYRVMKFPRLKIKSEAIVELSHFATKKSLSLYESLKNSEVLGKLDEKSRGGLKILLELIEKHTVTAREKSAEQVFVEVVNDLGFAGVVENDYQNARYLEAFRRKIQNFQAESADKFLRTFMQEISFEIEAGGEGELEFDPEAGPEAIKLMTVHGAKGLEFSHIFTISLVDKRFPTIERKEPIEIPQELIKDILPTGDIHLEEERRLFYVAMTRAKEGLYFSWAHDYGGKTRKKPSRFLFELGLAEESAQKPTGEVVLQSPKARSKIDYPLPKYFSFSQISLFRKCPLQYKHRYILRIPGPGSASLSFGQTIHTTLEKFLRVYQRGERQADLFGKTSASYPKLPLLLKFYEECFIDDWFESKRQLEDYRKRGVGILNFLYEEFSKHKPAPKYLEEKFKLKLHDAWIAGKIDRADATPAGLVIIDYKTGSSRPIAKVDKEQLLLYQWAVLEYYREKVADLQYWFLSDTLKKVSFLGTAEEIDKLKEDFWKTIQEMIETTKNDGFYEKDMRVSHECEFRNLEL